MQVIVTVGDTKREGRFVGFFTDPDGNDLSIVEFDNNLLTREMFHPSRVTLATFYAYHAPRITTGNDG